METENKKIDEITNSTMSLASLADVNLIIGKPITTISGFQVIPFSKVTMGSLSGGGEYGDVKVLKDGEEPSFAGGNGSVVSMKPMGFIIDDGKDCRMIRVTDEALDSLIEHAGEVLRNITKKG